MVDNGPYTSAGRAMVFRALYMLSGAYYIPAVKALGKLVYTNNPWGAARGAGPPQANFALESAMDMLAEKIEIRSLEFRRMNSLKPGQPKSVGRVVDQWPFPELVEAVRPHYDRAKKEAADYNRKGGPIRRGVGLGTHSFGISMSGDSANAAVELDPMEVSRCLRPLPTRGKGTIPCSPRSRLISWIFP